ncbi:MAG: hypothetical protein HQK83_07960 [Fibrobacteria bacterium]|nr:hypothetical protein [Fibrobacteria bacterium]
MKKTSAILISTFVLAVLLAGGMSWRIWSQHRSFEHMVKESLKTSEGYDQKFLDLVNRLEDLLATRASFGYTGEKDPMTGKRRVVVKSIPRKKGKKRATAKKEIKEVIDPVKLTAIIQDDNGQYTAIVMDEDRSLSVNIGEVVRGRKIIEITAEAVIMAGDSLFYKYDISGKRLTKPKSGGAITMPAKKEKGKKN